MRANSSHDFNCESHAKVTRRRSTIALATVVVALGVLYFGAGLPPGEATVDGEPAHYQIECSTCHRMQAGKLPGRSNDLMVMPNASDCLKCHNPQGAANETSQRFHTAKNRDCLECHSFHNPDELRINETIGSLSMAKSAIDLCGDCHIGSDIPEVSPGHRIAAQLMHGGADGQFAENPSDFCTACHNRDGNLPITAPELNDFPRFHLQASHVYGVEVVPGFRRSNSLLKLQDEFPEEMPLFAGKMECQTCHSLVSGEADLLTKTIEGGLCNDCHDVGTESAEEFVMSSK